MTAYLAGLVFLRAEDDERATGLGVGLCILAAMYSFAAENGVPECYASQASIARRAQVDRRTLQRTLLRLVKLGLIAHGGIRGKTVRWLLLFLVRHTDAQEPVNQGRHSDAQGPASHGRTSTSGTVTHKTTEVPSTTEQSRTRARARELPEATEEEHAAVVAEVRRRRPDVNDRLFRYIVRKDGPDILDEIRANGRKTDLAAKIAELRKMPDCDHGVAGGDQLHPIGGEPLCVDCRSLRRETAA